MERSAVVEVCEVGQLVTHNVASQVRGHKQYVYRDSDDTTARTVAQGATPSTQAYLLDLQAMSLRLLLDQVNQHSTVALRDAPQDVSRYSRVKRRCSHIIRVAGK